jgi:hypothetical protein
MEIKRESRNEQEWVWICVRVIVPGIRVIVGVRSVIGPVVASVIGIIVRSIIAAKARSVITMVVWSVIATVVRAMNFRVVGHLIGRRTVVG